MAARGELAHGTGTDDHHFRRGHTADATEHEALAALVAAQVFSGDLDAGVARDLAHGADDGVDAFAVLDEVPGHGGHLLVHHLAQRILGLHGELQGGDEDLLGPQQLDLLEAGRCDLDDEVRLEDLLGAFDHLGASLGVVAVLELHGLAHSAFHQHIVPTAHQCGDARRREGYAVLLEARFLGDADEEVAAFAAHFLYLFLGQHGHLAGQLLEEFLAGAHAMGAVAGGAGERSNCTLRSPSPSCVRRTHTVSVGNRSFASSGHSTKQ